MNSAPPRIYLASRSPRRRELLNQIHVAFETLPFRAAPREDSEISEHPLSTEYPDQYVERVARAKAAHAVTLIALRRLPQFPVLAADTTIDLDGAIIGKPANADEAAEILLRLAGRTHRVLTGVAVAEGHRVEFALSASEVRVADIEADELRRYVASGEPQDKAGAYAIQGRAAGFIAEIRGSYSGIVGLPVFETIRLLRRFDRRF